MHAYKVSSDYLVPNCETSVVADDVAADHNYTTQSPHPAPPPAIPATTLHYTVTTPSSSPCYPCNYTTLHSHHTQLLPLLSLQLHYTTQSPHPAPPPAIPATVLWVAHRWGHASHYYYYFIIIITTTTTTTTTYSASCCIH